MALSVGFFSANAQIILLREVLNFGKGNELTVASALFFWLAGIGLGSLIFSYVRSRKRPERSIYIIGWAGIVVAVGCTSISRVFGIFFPHFGVSVGVGELLSCCASSMIPPGAAMGALFPLVVEAGRRKISGSAMYLLEAAGSAVGGLVFTFLIAGNILHFAALALAAVPLLAAQTFLFGTTLRGRGSRAAAWAAGLAFAVASLAGSRHLDRITHSVRWSSIAGGLERLNTVETRHQRLDLAAEEGQYSIFSDGSFDFAFPDPYGAGRLADAVLLEHQSPDRVLVLGGNPVDAARRAKAHGTRRLDYVQMDPVVMNLVREARPVEVERLFCPSCIGSHKPVDGRLFIRLAEPAAYDVVWVEMPDPMTLLVNRCYSREFYGEVKRILRPGGLFVSGFNLDYSAPQKASRKYAASVFKTLVRNFKEDVLAFSGKVIVFAAREEGVVTGDPEELSRRASERGLDPLMYPPELFGNLFDPDRSRWLRKIFEEHDARVNTDMHPVSYRLQLQYFLHLTGSTIERGKESLGEIVVQKIWGIPWWTAFLPGLVVLLLLAALRKRPGAASAGLVYAMSVTGASGILLQIVLLFAYQTFSGVMYEGIGLLYAAFMAGLVAGTALGGRMRRRSAVLSEIVVIVNAAAAAALIPLASGALLLIPFLVVASGFAVGFAFPHLYSAHRRLKEAGNKEGFVTSAGIIDAADHVGASVGALLCALVLVPSFGLAGSLLLVAAYKATTLAVILVTR